MRYGGVFAEDARRAGRAGASGEFLGTSIAGAECVGTPPREGGLWGRSQFGAGQGVPSCLEPAVMVPPPEVQPMARPLFPRLPVAMATVPLAVAVPSQ